MTDASPPAPDAEAPTKPVSPLRAAWGGWPGSVVRLSLALLPLIWLTRKIPLRDVAMRAHDVGARGMSIAFLTLLVTVSLGAQRWRTMMRAYGAVDLPPLPTLMRHLLVGLYFNVLPSGVAGDAVRAHRLRGSLPDLATSLTVIFLERVAGLLGLCIVAAIAFVMSDDIRDDIVAKVLELGLLGALGLSAVVLLAPWVLARRPALRELVAKVPVAGRIALSIPVARSGWGVASSVLQSVLIQGMVVLSVSFLVQPLAPSVTLVVCARVVPAIILTTYIPLTPGGLGQRELVFRYMFGLVGVAPDAAVATSLLFFAMLMSLSALGGISLLAERALGLDARPADAPPTDAR